MNCRLQHLLLFLFCSSAFVLHAQSDAQRSFIEHKIRTNLEQYLEFHFGDHDKLNLQRPTENMDRIESRSDELFINQTPEAESELHAAINPVDTNNIIVAAMRSNPESFLEPLTFPIYYTNDFGATWQVSEFNGINPGELAVGGGDPIIVFDTEGTAYLTWLTLTADLTLNFEIALRFAESKDGGATWTEYEQPLDSGEGVEVLLGGFGKFVDKEWLAVDVSDSPYRNNIYAAYLTILSTEEEGLTTDITLRKKTAEATAFTDTSVVVNSNDYKLVQFTSIDVDNAGTVHVSFAGTLDSLTWAMYYAQSTDGGETFAPEQKVSDLHIPRFSADEPEVDIVGISEERLYPCPHLVVDKSGGAFDSYIYMVWTANGRALKETEGLDIYFARSKDGGQSWSPATILNDDGIPESHQFYPSVVVNENGKLLVSWYDRRNDTANVMTDYYMTYSDDGGATFVEDFPVSTASADFSVIGDLNGAFGIGEYTQTIASPNFGIPIWSDGRTNDGNIDLFLAFVPLDNSGFVNVSTISDQFSISYPYPNPARAMANIDLNLEAATTSTVKLYSTDGKYLQTIFSGKLQAGTHTFSIEPKAAGSYLVEVNTDFGKAIRQLVVEK